MKKLYEEYCSRMRLAVTRMNDAAETKDLALNRVNYGLATAFCIVLHDFGHKIDLRVYSNGDYLVTDKIYIDGDEIKLK